MTPHWWNGSADVVFNPANPDGATFGAGSGTAGTVTLGTSIVCSNIIFNAATVGNYTIAGGGNTLAQTNRVILATVDATISANLSRRLSIMASHGAANAPSGVLILSGNNTFTNFTVGENANNPNNVGAPNTTCAVRPLGNSAFGFGTISYNSQGSLTSPRIELTGGIMVTNLIAAAGRNNPFCCCSGLWFGKYHVRHFYAWYWWRGFKHQL